ncbi:ribonuclease M5 [Streptobacillus moniliformis]|uniref:ribonuclease M5 n=1 Tax=Streptobacillus moniliformis TaxID=34105 RepID=UPI0007E36229|nr:ribonuclease M5 [Streptobacillus moniliformis]
MKKLKIDEIIVVEGKDDVTRLSQVIDATIVQLNGSTGLSKEKISYINELSKRKDILLFTDPDFTGKKIREKINKNIEGKVINIYVSREEATKNGNIGVENIDNKKIYEIFSEYLSKRLIENKDNKKYIYDIEKLLENGLVGNKLSKLKREIIGDILKIGYYNSKGLLSMLNCMNISYSDFENAILMMNKKIDKKEKIGIIFGKFIPLHMGHLNFIRYASKEVDKLHVLLCVERNRDLKLLINSSLPKILTENDRMYYLKKELEMFANVEIHVLREEGIAYYPNGWSEWTDRVIKFLKDNNIKINTVFTNEIEDKNNYEKFFVNNEVFSKELDVHFTDPERFEYNVSSTKIRNNFEKYKRYLPKSLQDFFSR